MSSPTPSRLRGLAIAATVVGAAGVIGGVAVSGGGDNPSVQVPPIRADAIPDPCELLDRTAIEAFVGEPVGAPDPIMSHPAGYSCRWTTVRYTPNDHEFVQVDLSVGGELSEPNPVWNKVEAPAFGKDAYVVAWPEGPVVRFLAGDVLVAVTHGHQPQRDHSDDELRGAAEFALLVVERISSAPQLELPPTDAADLPDACSLLEVDKMAGLGSFARGEGKLGGGLRRCEWAGDAATVHLSIGHVTSPYAADVAHGDDTVADEAVSGLGTLGRLVTTRWGTVTIQFSVGSIAGIISFSPDAEGAPAAPSSDTVEQVRDLAVRAHERLANAREVSGG